VLAGVDEDGVRAAAELACEKVVAEKPDRAAADVAERLRKLNDSEFAATHVQLDWTAPLHLAAKDVNGLRRCFAERLTAARAQARPVARPRLTPNDVPYPETGLDFRANVLNDKARAFYRRHGVTELEPAAESGLAMAERAVMPCRYCLKYELGLCPREPASPRAGAAAEPWLLVDDEGRKLRLCFRCDRGDCAMDIVYEG
jgi:23S rRNA 5-hydroxycytidine C2501 synthase